LLEGGSVRFDWNSCSAERDEIANRSTVAIIVASDGA